MLGASVLAVVTVARTPATDAGNLVYLNILYWPIGMAVVAVVGGVPGSSCFVGRFTLLGPPASGRLRGSRRTGARVPANLGRWTSAAASA